MPTLKLRFPGGRYHATPWGHHVNEGLIEWPPSPWRLLRALVACGFSSQGWIEIPTLARQLIDKLAEVLPSYRLPPASAAHSRHFMPVGVLKKGREQTTLVFDTWANIGDGRMFIHWPCQLSGDETALLCRLAAALGYLGRSESWVEAEVLSDSEPNPVEFNAYPHQYGTNPGRAYEQVSLIAAIPPNEYSVWRDTQTNAVLEPHPLPSGKRPTAKLVKEREKAIAPYPPDLVSCLTRDTAWWKGYGWSQPPGSQRVLYWRRSDSLQVSVPPATRLASASTVSTILLSITTPSGRRSALPPITRTLPQAEMFHRAVVGRLGNGHHVDCPELTGKDGHDLPLHHHGHAHTIPVDLDDDGRIDHIFVHAQMGLRDAAQHAIRMLRRTWTKGGVGDLQLAIVGSGELELLRRLPPPLNRQIEAILGPFAGARVWTSVTPFVPPRFLKRHGKNTLHGQINSELNSRGLPEAVACEFDLDLTRKLRHFVRRRNRTGRSPRVDLGYGLRLRFAEPVHGPLLLGYASHYGLGLFAAVGE